MLKIPFLLCAAGSGYIVWHEYEMMAKSGKELNNDPAVTSLKQAELVENYPGEGLDARLDPQVAALRGLIRDYPAPGQDELSWWNLATQYGEQL
eukprot:2561864-Pyramimonas_sp.AAC.1